MNACADKLNMKIWYSRN